MVIPYWVITTLGVYLVTSLIASVWWASNIATTLSFMRESMDKMEKHITSIDGEYATKVDVAKDIALMQKELDAAWKKVDKLEDAINGKLMGGGSNV